jgi:arylsulfatase A-like enzyme
LTPSIESGDNSGTVKWNTFVACGLSRFLEAGTDDACIPKSVATLAEDMRSAGYWTLGVVSNELLYRPSGYDRGFDAWVEVGLAKPGQELNIFEASPIRTAVHVNREVKTALANRPTDRFFLYVHYLDVHDYGLFKRDYAENVERFDGHLGALIDQLETDGLLAGSTVILTSDHGEILHETYASVATAKHFGNPALAPVLEIPLIVKPPTPTDSHAFVRSQDVRDLIRGLAGLTPAGASELEADELFLSEMFYQTYRKGRWKSHWPRGEAPPLLFDLLADPTEKNDLATDGSVVHAEILASHRKRIDALSQTLAADESQFPALDDHDVMRLRALGYIETTEDSFGKPPPPQEPNGATAP